MGAPSRDPVHRTRLSTREERRRAARRGQPTPAAGAPGVRVPPPPPRRSWRAAAPALIAGVVALSVAAILFAVGAFVPAIAVLVVVAVAAWAIEARHQLLDLRGRYRGENVRLPDYTVTPAQAARLETFDAAMSDLGVGDGGVGGADGGGSGS